MMTTWTDSACSPKFLNSGFSLDPPAYPAAVRTTPGRHPNTASDLQKLPIAKTATLSAARSSSPGTTRLWIRMANENPTTRSRTTPTRHTRHPAAARCRGAIVISDEIPLRN